MNKIGKLLAKPTKRKREKTQINKIRGKRRNITRDTTKIQNTIREYFENLFSNVLENLEEMDKFLDTYDLPKLNLQYINNLNRCLTSNEIEAIIVSQQRKVQDQTDSLLNSTRPLKKN
jgi:hypothetical protein